MLALLACLALPQVAAPAPAAPLPSVEDAGERPRRLVVMIEERSFASWPALEEIAREFERRHPDVRVHLTDQGGAVGQQDKTRFLLIGDLQLDVARIDVTEFGAFLEEGALLDLQPYLDADPRFHLDDYLPVVEGFRAPNGHLYGLPSTFTPYVMYANLDLLERAGLSQPRAGWTWDDLLAICRATTRDLDGDGRIDQYGISLTQWLQALVPWIWQNGGELLSEDHSHSRLAEPEVVEALRFLRRLLHDERLASFDASFEVQFSQGLFQAGRCALYGPVGYWETYRLQRITDFRWDVVPLPIGKREATAIAMTGFVVPRTAREPELACEFVCELAGEFYQRTLARIGNGVPGLRSVALSESFLSPERPPPSEQVFLDVLAHARFLPALANWRKIESLCQAELQTVLLSPRCDVAAACERMAAKTDAFLERERKRGSLASLPRGTLTIAAGVSILAALALFVGARGRRPGRAELRQERQAHALLGLWALGFAVFFLGPAVVTLVLSLCEWSPLREISDVRWLGLDHYARLASDDTFRTSLGVTSLYAALSVPLGLAVALGLALLARGDDRLSSAMRTVFYLPAIIAPVIVAAVWRFLLDPERGLVNDALHRIGIDGPAWTRDAHWVIPSFVVMGLWSVGAQMLVFLAALKALDRNLEDAARVDGAGAWRRLWHVTLPGLTPVILFNLVLGIVAAFQIFAQPYVMTQGGPGDASRFLVLYLYETGFRHLDMGYAAAIAWVVFALLAALCLIVVASSKRWVHYAARGGA
jgi:ABC-type sugar transport system permease subunit/ABC-type glycerol-3-phosphate transport system substrate-binding protein